MIIRNYISQKLASFDIRLTEADYCDMSDFGLDPDAEKSAGNSADVKRFILAILRERIDSLPKSVSEGDMSLSFGDRMQSYYDSLCRELGVDNVFSKKSKIIFL